MIFLMFPSGTCRRPQVTGVEMRRPVTQSLAVAGVSVISRAQGGACASELGGGLKPRAPLEPVLSLTKGRHPGNLAKSPAVYPESL